MNDITTRVSRLPGETVFDQYVREVHMEISTAGEIGSRPAGVDRESMLWCAFYCVARDGNLVLGLDWSWAVTVAVCEADAEMKAGSCVAELRALHRQTLSMAAGMNLDCPVDYASITCPYCLGTGEEPAVTGDGPVCEVCGHPDSPVAASEGMALLGVYLESEPGTAGEGTRAPSSANVVRQVWGRFVQWAMRRAGRAFWLTLVLCAVVDLGLVAAVTGGDLGWLAVTVATEFVIVGFVAAVIEWVVPPLVRLLPSKDGLRLPSEGGER